MKIKTGIGIDVHRLEAGREFWLGGIKMGHEKGCVAHSDGDVLIHAICDALLGATGLGDIGQHFPDTCPAYKGIDSKLLLQKTKALIDHRGYAISNIDSVPGQQGSVPLNNREFDGDIITTIKILK